MTYDEVVSLAPKVTSEFVKNRDLHISSPVLSTMSGDEYEGELLNLNNETSLPFSQKDSAEQTKASTKRSENSTKSLAKGKKQPKFCFSSSTKLDKNRIKTPTVPAVVRANIIRQCSMPSYQVIPKQPETSSTEADEGNGSQQVCRCLSINFSIFIKLIFNKKHPQLFNACRDFASQLQCHMPSHTVLL